MAQHAHTSSDTSPEADQVAHYPAMSIVDLARRHCVLDEFYRDVDRAKINHLATYGDVEKDRGSLDSRRGPLVLRARELDAARTRVEAEQEALIALILATQAVTLQDAAAQLLVAVQIADHCMEYDDERRDEEWKQVHRALIGSMKVVVREAGLTLREISGSCFASRWCDPALLLTEVAVPVSKPDLLDVCADEPLPAYA